MHSYKSFYSTVGGLGRSTCGVLRSRRRGVTRGNSGYRGRWGSSTLSVCVCGCIFSGWSLTRPPIVHQTVVRPCRWCYYVGARTRWRRRKSPPRWLERSVALLRIGLVDPYIWYTPYSIPSPAGSRSWRLPPTNRRRTSVRRRSGPHSDSYCGCCDYKSHYHRTTCVELIDNYHRPAYSWWMNGSLSCLLVRCCSLAGLAGPW